MSIYRRCSTWRVMVLQLLCKDIIYMYVYLQTLFYVESDGTPVALSDDKPIRRHGKGSKLNTVASYRSAELDDKHLYAVRVFFGSSALNLSVFVFPSAPPVSRHLCYKTVFLCLSVCLWTRIAVSFAYINLTVFYI